MQTSITRDYDEIEALGAEYRITDCEVTASEDGADLLHLGQVEVWKDAWVPFRDMTPEILHALVRAIGTRLDGEAQAIADEIREVEQSWAAEARADEDRLGF